jgi:hypothetical protein
VVVGLPKSRTSPGKPDEISTDAASFLGIILGELRLATGTVLVMFYAAFRLRHIARPPNKFAELSCRDVKRAEVKAFRDANTVLWALTRRRYPSARRQPRRLVNATHVANSARAACSRPRHTLAGAH